MRNNLMICTTLVIPADGLEYAEERSRPISVQAAEDVWLTPAHASADAVRTRSVSWAAWTGALLHKALAAAAAS